MASAWASASGRATARRTTGSSEEAHRPCGRSRPRRGPCSTDTAGCRTGSRDDRGCAQTTHPVWVPLPTYRPIHEGHRPGWQSSLCKHSRKCFTDHYLHLGISSSRLTRCMTYSSYLRCPTCASLDVYGFEPTTTGQSHYCPACGKTWRVTVEDKTLDMIGASLAARRSKTRESG